MDESRGFAEDIQSRRGFERDEKPEIDGFEIGDQIGKGGMGRVYFAVHKFFNEKRAIKVVCKLNEEDETAVRRFCEECRVAREIRHTNIVAFHNAGLFRHLGQERAYLEMEFVDGKNLRQAFELVRPNVREIETVAVSLCTAISFIHEQGYLHRDIKPENILLANDGRVLVSDFGIAKPIEAGSPRSNFTLSGEYVGTKAYMAPEVKNYAEQSVQSEVYSIGCVIAELVTGRVPTHSFPEADLTPINLAHWVPLLRKATEHSPSERFQSVDEMLDAIQEYCVIHKSRNFNDDSQLDSAVEKCAQSVEGIEEVKGTGAARVGLHTTYVVLAMLLTGLVFFALVYPRISSEGKAGSDLESGTELTVHSAAGERLVSDPTLIGLFGYPQHFHDGVSLARRGEYREAEELLASLRSQGSVYGDIGFGWVRIMQERYDDATKYFNRADLMSKDEIAEWPLLSGYLHAILHSDSSDKHQRAVIIAERILDKKPTIGKHDEYRFEALVALERKDEAIALASQTDHEHARFFSRRLRELGW